MTSGTITFDCGQQNRKWKYNLPIEILEISGEMYEIYKLEENLPAEVADFPGFCYWCSIE